MYSWHPTNISCISINSTQVGNQDETESKNGVHKFLQGRKKKIRGKFATCEASLLVLQSWVFDVEEATVVLTTQDLRLAEEQGRAEGQIDAW